MIVIVLQNGRIQKTLTDVDEIVSAMMYCNTGELVEHIRIHQRGTMGSYRNVLKGFEYVVKEESEWI